MNLVRNLWGGENNMKRYQRGQVTVEVAVLFAFIIAAFVFMGIYLQRGAQGGVKGNVDSLGQQFSLVSEFSRVTHSKTLSTQDTTKTGQCADYAHRLARLDPSTGNVMPDSKVNYVPATDCTPANPGIINFTATLP